MANNSPLDFYSSSAKKKVAPVKERFPVPTTKALDRNLVSAKNVKAVVDDPELSAALDRATKLGVEIKEKIEEAASKAGKSVEEMKTIIATSPELSAKDREFLKQSEKDLIDKLSPSAKGSSPAQASSSSSKKENKPTGNLKSQSRNAKRKWMPMG